MQKNNGGQHGRRCVAYHRDFRRNRQALWGECFWNNYSALWYCSGYLGYVVLAHYIRVHINWSQRKRLAVGASCFVVGAAFTAWSFWWKAVPGVTMDTLEQ